MGVCLLLQSLLRDEQIMQAPVLILGNKIDIPGAASEDEIRTVFNLHGQTTGKVCIHVNIIPFGEFWFHDLKNVYLHFCNC